jgi:hypothetical protein
LSTESVTCSSLRGEAGRPSHEVRPTPSPTSRTPQRTTAAARAPA